MVAGIYDEDDWEEEGDLDDLLGMLAWHDNTGIYTGTFEDSRREAEMHQHTRVQRWVDGVL
jgi:hypothetical protein